MPIITSSLAIAYVTLSIYPQYYFFVSNIIIMVPDLELRVIIDLGHG